MIKRNRSQQSYQAAGRKGGAATAAKLGKNHYRKIGAMGAARRWKHNKHHA